MPKDLLKQTRLFLLGNYDSYRMGLCYEYGWHIEKNSDIAFEYYQKAAKEGNPNAYLKLAQFYERRNDKNQALQAYLGAAVRGHEQGKLYLLEQAEFGNATAAYYIGFVFEQEQAWKKAKKYYEIAAEKKEAAAMFRLGQLYQMDRISKNPPHTAIISKNLSNELAWYRKATALYSKHGLNVLLTLSKTEPTACVHLAQMYEFGEGLQVDEAKAIKYYQKAIELGDKETARYLGDFYQIDHNTFKKDLNKACEYYLIAAKLGCQKALPPLERLGEQLHSQMQLKIAHLYQSLPFNNWVKALKWYNIAEQAKGDIPKKHYPPSSENLSVTPKTLQLKRLNTTISKTENREILLAQFQRAKPFDPNNFHIDPETLRTRYQQYETYLENFVSETYDPQRESQIRFKLMELLLAMNHWTFLDVEKHLTFPWIAIERDKNGWMKPSRAYPIPNHPMVEKFEAMDGLEVNHKTGEITFLLRHCDESSPSYSQLLTVFDIKELLEHQYGDVVFSLDPIDPKMRYHPFNKMRFEPSSLYHSELLHTLLLADYLLKFLTIKQEVQGIPPYETQPLNPFIEHLPPYLKSIIEELH